MTFHRNGKFRQRAEPNTKGRWSCKNNGIPYAPPATLAPRWSSGATRSSAGSPVINQARLTAAEWNVLVDAVRTGALGSIGKEDAPVESCDCGCECC